MTTAALAPAILTPEDELHWLALRMTSGLGARRSMQLLQQFRTPQRIFRASKPELEGAGLSSSIAQSIASGCPFEDAVTQQQRLRKTGAHLIPIFDARYPAPLKQIFDPPVALYAKGRLELLQTVMLAVGVPQTVSLPATPGTGYAWDAGTLPPGLQTTGSKTVPNQPGLAGGRAQQLMTFVSSAPGEAEITFVLRRAWMPPDPSDQRVTIIFNTKP